MIGFLAHSCFREAKIKLVFCGRDRERSMLAGHMALSGQQVLVRERMRLRQEYSCDQREREGRKKCAEERWLEKLLGIFLHVLCLVFSSQKVSLRLCDCGEFLSAICSGSPSEIHFPPPWKIRLCRGLVQGFSSCRNYWGDIWSLWTCSELLPCTTTVAVYD